MILLFPFPKHLTSRRLHYIINAIVALTFSADAQHRRSAPLSALTYPSHQGTTAHVQVTRSRRLIHTTTLPLCFPPYRSTTIYAYPLWLYFTITSDHHSHWSLHNRPPFSIEYLSLYPSYPLIVSLPRISFHFSISLPLFSTIFSHTASLSMRYICSLFLLSSFSFPSHSYWLYHPLFILALTHPLIHPSSHWLAIVLLPFPHSSEHSSRSYWLIARLSLLYESDSIATSSCIYTYHE